jgi:subfamily B ATP-binding cassette protein MsbA
MIRVAIYSRALFGLTFGRMLAFAILSLFAALLEGFSMAVILPVLEFAEKGWDVLLLGEKSHLWELLISFHQLFGLSTNLFSLLIGAVAIMFIRVAVVYARQVYSSWLTQEIQHSARGNIFEAYLAMNYGAITGVASGGIINVLTTEVQRATASFVSLFALVSNLSVLFCFVVLLFLLSVPLTILALILIITAAVIASYYVRHTRQYSYSASGANDRFSRIVLERVGASRLIKLSAAADREGKFVRAASQTIRDLFFSLNKASAKIDLIIEPIVLASCGGIFYVALGRLGMTLAETGVFMIILLRLLPLAKEVIKSRQTFNSCIGSLATVITEFDKALTSREPTGGSLRIDRIRKSIKLENVIFKYPGNDIAVLNDVSIEIPAGKTIALMGPSGAGKTTLVDIIAGLRLPVGGRILYDGIDRREVNWISLRRSVAFVSQDSTLLDDSIAGNLRFTCPDATESALWEALNKAQLADWVRSLEFGLETHVGERGVRLSGGQKQRISMARALLQDASVLVLDEPTSALDAETEEAVRAVMEQIRSRGETTIIVIAHRFSTVQNADKIVVLIDGKVAESGKHHDLLGADGWYGRFSDSQHI